MSSVGISGSYLNSCEDVCLLSDPTLFCWTESAYLFLKENTWCKQNGDCLSASTGTRKQENWALFLLLLCAFKWPLPTLLFHKIICRWRHVQSLVLQVLRSSKRKSVMSPAHTGFAFWEYPQGGVQWSRSEISKASGSMGQGVSAWVCLEWCRMICQWKSIFIELSVESCCEVPPAIQLRAWQCLITSTGTREIRE